MKYLFIFLGLISFGLLPSAVDYVAHSSALTVIVVGSLAYLCYRIGKSPLRVSQAVYDDGSAQYCSRNKVR